MRVTIDLERDIIIIPDNFFERVSKDNERIKKFRGQVVSGVDRIKHSFHVAMADTDNRLLTQTNSKKSEVTKVEMTEEEIAELDKTGNQN